MIVGVEIENSYWSVICDMMIDFCVKNVIAIGVFCVFVSSSSSRRWMMVMFCEVIV